MTSSTMGSRIIVVLALVLVALGHPASVWAQSTASSADGHDGNVQKARRHFLLGRQAFEEKRYSIAFQEFEIGYAMEPRAGFLLDMGHAARRMGDQRRALDLYQRFLTTDPPDGERRVAVKLVAELRRELPAAAADSSAATTASTATGASVASTLDPLLAAPDPAAATTATTLSLVDVGSSPEVTAREIESAGGSPIYRKWWFWAGAGGVAAGVATAILIGTLASGSSARDSGTWGQLKL